MRAETGDQRRDAVAFLDSQFARARDLEAATEGGPSREDGQFVDQAGHFSGPNHGGAVIAVTDANACRRTRRRLLPCTSISITAPIRSSARTNPEPAGIETDAREFHGRTRQSAAAAAAQTAAVEGSPGTVSMSAGATACCPPSTETDTLVPSPGGCGAIGAQRPGRPARSDLAWPWVRRRLTCRRRQAPPA